MIINFFGFREGTKALNVNGDKEGREEDWELEELPRDEAKPYRGVATRMNFLGLDCPHIQFAIKDCQTDMGTPTRGSWKRAKKMGMCIQPHEISARVMIS